MRCTGKPWPNWNCGADAAADNARADVNQDGTVRASDMLQAWGARGRDASDLADPALAAAEASGKGDQAPLQTAATADDEMIAAAISDALARVPRLDVSPAPATTPTDDPPAAMGEPTTMTSPATPALDPAPAIDPPGPSTPSPAPAAPSAELEPSLDTDLTPIPEKPLAPILPA